MSETVVGIASPGRDAGDFEIVDFEVTDRAFDRIRELVVQHTGIDLSDAKRQLVYRRIGRRLRALHLPSFDAYCRRLEDDSSGEVEEFVNAITTNLTAFFREAHHFEFLADEALLAIRSANDSSRRVRIWSAGCSTGEEPYSVAMTCREAMRLDDWDLRILATDIDSAVVAEAARGRYRAESVEPVSRDLRVKYLTKVPETGEYQVADSLKALLDFRQLNLHAAWPMRGPFDVIFCRNVSIYFEKQVQKALFDRFADILSPNGYIVIGHSESLFKVTDRFRALGRTVYQRCA